MERTALVGGGLSGQSWAIVFGTPTARGTRSVIPSRKASLASGSTWRPSDPSEFSGASAR